MGMYFARMIMAAFSGAIAIGVLISPFVSNGMTKSERFIRENALKRGWSPFLVKLATALMHYTTCTFTMSEMFLVLRVTGQLPYLQKILLKICSPCMLHVFVLFWSLYFFGGPWFFYPRQWFPKNEKLAQLWAWRITVNPGLQSKKEAYFIWTLLTTMHVLMPLWILLELCYDKKDSDSEGNINNGFFLPALVYAFVYLIWNKMAWTIRGFAPYPIQEVLHNKGLSKPFEAGAVLLLFALCRVSKRLHGTLACTCCS